MIPMEPVDQQNQILPANNQRRAVFLGFLGDRAYEVVRRACLPGIPSAFSIPHLLQILRQKFEDPGLVETNRQIFHNRRQRDNESAEDFVYALQSLAADCLFDAASYSDIMKSRLIGGVCNDSTREKLMLESTNMNYDQTKIFFTQIEAARAQSRRIALANTANAVFEDTGTNKRPQQDVQRVTQRLRRHQPSRSRPQVQPSQGGSAFRPPERSSPTPHSTGMCWRCGRARGHTPDACPAKKWYCFSCHGKGHAMRQCTCLLYTSPSPRD